MTTPREISAAAYKAAYQAARDELDAVMHPEQIDAAIAAYLKAMEAAGWKLCPREATEEMCFAADNACPGDSVWSRIHFDDIKEMLRVMHDAAPRPEEG